jgi:hypothetical protein
MHVDARAGGRLRQCPRWARLAAPAAAAPAMNFRRDSPQRQPGLWLICAVSPADVAENAFAPSRIYFLPCCVWIAYHKRHTRVMPALVAGIHDFLVAGKTWMAGT